MAKRNVLLSDHFTAQLLQQDLTDVVLFFWIDVVRADQIKFLAEILDQPGNKFLLLLVRHSAGIDYVLRTFTPFVKRRIPIQIVILLEHRQHRLPAGRGIGPEHADALVPNDELARFLREGRRVGGRIFDDGYHFHPVDAAGSVDFFDRQYRRLVERRFDDGGGARQGIEDADLDFAAGSLGEVGILDPDVGKSESSRRPGSGSSLQEVTPFDDHIVFSRTKTKSPTTNGKFVVRL